MLFEKQAHQEECVANIVSVLRNVDFENKDFSGLTKSLKELAKEKNYRPFPIENRPKLDVLMETGTGKTFTYLQTIFELHREFNQTKFIIVLPRTAIKLGVIQNIKLTKEYFFDKYRKHLNFINYPEDGFSGIHHDFIHSGDLQILIITNSAFNSRVNRINQRNESICSSGSLWQAIVEKEPIVIIDEPHLLKGNRTTSYLEELDSLFIRFGATYPEDKGHKISNLVYALDSISAFNQYLVKQIGVSTIYAQREQSGLSIKTVHSQEKKCKAFYTINKQPYEVTLRIGDDIGAKTQLKDYRGIILQKFSKNRVFLSNRSTLEPAKGSYQLSNEEARLMIREAINLHFDKEEKFFAKNTKTISLFFINRISDFKLPNPIIKNIFEEEYKRIRDAKFREAKDKKYKDFLARDYQDGKLKVHDGYFSGDKGSKDEQVATGVNKILNDKETLLSLAEPLRFIFSVWALQEGWDNPNVFTICKLSSAKKDTSRRQQVGRGLRIAVDDKGRRLTYKHLGEKESNFYDINKLDVVVSEQDVDFIRCIQEEIIDASFSVMGDTISYQQLIEKGLNSRAVSHLLDVLEKRGIISYDGGRENYKINGLIYDFLKEGRDYFLKNRIDDSLFETIKEMFRNSHLNPVKDNNIKRTTKIRKGNWMKFQELWEMINKKSEIIYSRIKEEELIQKISKEFNAESFHPIEKKVIRERYNSQTNEIEKFYEKSIEDASLFNDRNLTQYIHKFTKDEHLPLQFTVRLFSKLDKNHFYKDPQKAQDRLKELIQENIHSTILKSIDYEFYQTKIYPNELQDYSGKPKDEIRDILIGK